MWTVLGIIGFLFLALVGLVFLILGSINPKWAMMKNRGPVYAVFAPILAIGVIGPIVMLVVAIMGAEPTASEETEPIEEDQPADDEQSPMDTDPPVEEEDPFEEEEDPFELDEGEEEFEDEVASRENPAHPEEMITFMLEHYTYGLMELDVTLLDTIRGEEAWELIEEADEYNEPPEDGTEYLIAYFDIALNQIETEPFNISSFDFDLVSSEGTAYSDPTAYVTGLDNPLETDLYEGANTEGHVVFQVDEDDEFPYIVFLRDLNGVWYQSEEASDIDFDDEEAV